MKLKDITNALIHRANIVLLRLRLFSQFRLGLLKQYQPDPFSRESADASYTGRACIDRFEAISKVLPPNTPLSVLDVGCNIGYFVFRMAERGGFCLGTDIGRNEIMAAQALAYVHEIQNAAFTRFKVTPETVHFLPQVDTIFCLSIFHHFVRYFGEQDALEMMRDLSGKAGKYLVFETGQPDESGVAWADKLSFMRPDPREWIHGFLLELGFNKVHNLGKFQTSVSHVKRHLFVAERTSESDS